MHHRTSGKTIAILSNTSWSIYNFRRGLVRRLSAEGYKVLIICPRDQYTKKLEAEPCTYIPVNLSRHTVNPFFDLAYGFRILKILQSYKPDFVISYTVKPNIYGQIAARLLKIHRIAVVTGLGYLFIDRNWKTRIVKELYKHSFKGAKRVWFLNTEDLALFLGDGIVSLPQAVYLPGEGVDINYFKPAQEVQSSNGSTRFVYAGRLIKEKGVPEFVEAAKIIKTTYPDAQFQIAGFLEDYAPGAIRLEDIEDWEQSGTITYEGAFEDIRPILERSDCIVLPTYYREGVPRILLEAASMGIPVVGTNTPGCKDIVIEGENGFLCQEKNAPHLAKVLIKIMHLSKTERHLLGGRGREIVKASFREEIIIDSYLEFLKESMSSSINEEHKAPVKFN